MKKINRILDIITIVIAIFIICFFLGILKLVVNNYFNNTVNRKDIVMMFLIGILSLIATLKAIRSFKILNNN